VTTFNDWPYSPNGKLDGKRSDVAILGAPYDLGASTNGGGMRMAPTTIRQSRLERLTVAGVDAGDVAVEDGLDGITAAVKQVGKNTRRLIVLGGDDSINHAVLSGLNKQKPFLFRIDAHTDGESGELDHGSWISHVMQDGLTDRVLTMGVRTLDWDPNYIWMPDKYLDSIPLGPPVFVAVDIDGVDPAYAPGTSFPEPGGLTSAQALRMISMVCQKRVVVALTITEVLPHKDVGGITSLLANRIAQIAAQFAI
jgi:arginase family enzyme